MKNKEMNIEDMYSCVNKLIKDEKLKFKFYNSCNELEVIQVCQNKADNIIEINFRNIQKEYMVELKEILNKIESTSNK